jgi:hypothetical protein
MMETPSMTDIAFPLPSKAAFLRHLVRVQARASAEANGAGRAFRRRMESKLPKILKPLVDDLWPAIKGDADAQRAEVASCMATYADLREARHGAQRPAPRP